LDKEGAIFLLDYLLSTESRTVEFVEELALAGKGKNPVTRSTGRAEDIVFFDLETQKSAEEVGGWERSHLMRVSVAVTCSLRSDEFQLFTENRIKELLDELLAKDLVVGFNVKRFDYRVLSYYTDFDDAKIPTLDIHEVVMRYLGFPLSLERLSQATLGYGKTGNGLDAIRWFREGRTDKLAEYCSHDVKLVKELYEFGKENDYLLFEDKNKGILRIPVSWG
jgi:DEAD/DEAH box helicase domain-containing protein